MVPRTALLVNPNVGQPLGHAYVHHINDLVGPTWPIVGDSPLKHPCVLNVASLRIMWSFDGLIGEKHVLEEKCVGNEKKQEKKRVS